GFTPSELIFGHSVRGPLKILQEQLLCENHLSQTKNVLDHISDFRKRLHTVWEFAKKSLSTVQERMKTRYDKGALQRFFQPGDKVLVLLPIPGSSLKAKFVGPYEILAKLGETDYVVNTSDRKRKSRVCHVNMLKAYVKRDDVPQDIVSVVTASFGEVSPSAYAPESDGLKMNGSSFSLNHPLNSESLDTLSTKFAHLSESAQTHLSNLISDFSCLFGDSPTATHVLSHDIDVGSHPPVKQNAYRVNPEKRNLMKQETQYLLEHGLAVPSSSPWCSPCLLVPKSDGTSRFCTDYRKVSALTKPDSFPLPRVDDCVDRVGNSRFVTKLDLLKGYWQVPLTEKASEITAFATPDAFLQYKVMPFGLRNAGATFQRLMSKILSNIPNCEIYLDDVVCYSDTWEEHL
ncbi:MAG: reverse transcriptase family protein, partial [Plesiomonas shigelloides]